MAKDDFKFFSWAIEKIGVVLYHFVEECRKNRFEREDHEHSFEYAEFDILIKHPSGDVN